MTSNREGRGYNVFCADPVGVGHRGTLKCQKNGFHALSS